MKKHSLLIIISLIFCIIGLLLSSGAVCSPAWQTVTVFERHFYMESGLWMNCRRTSIYSPGRPLLATSFEVPICVYSPFFGSTDNYFTAQTDANFRNEPVFYAWQGHVFRLLLAANLFLIVSLFGFILTLCKKSPSRNAALISAALVILADLLHFIGLIVFIAKSREMQYRFYAGLQSAYEKMFGYSFYIELLGFIFISVSVILVFVAIRYLTVWLDVEINQRQTPAAERAYTAMRQVSANATDNIRYWNQS